MSFPSVPSFRINNYDPLLLAPFLLDSTALILAAGLALGQQSRSSTTFLAFVVPLQLQNTDSSASIGRATSPDGSSTRAMSVNTKQFHFRSIKVIPLFRIPRFTVSPYRNTWPKVPILQGPHIVLTTIVVICHAGYRIRIWENIAL